MADEYDVGYKKPPKHTQFQKGHSGNPKGRPKGTKNFKTDLLEELSEQVLITEGGNETRVSKQRAILKRAAQKALSGDARSISMMIGWVIHVLGINPESSDEEDLSPTEEDILENYYSNVYQAIVNSDTDEETT